MLERQFHKEMNLGLPFSSFSARLNEPNCSAGGTVTWALSPSTKGISEYGESYVRPGLLLLTVLLAFAVFYSFVGLRHDTARDRSAVWNGSGGAHRSQADILEPVGGQRRQTLAMESPPDNGGERRDHCRNRPLPAGPAL